MIKEEKMKLTIIGWCGAYPEANEATSGYLVQTEKVNILLDCGSGVLSLLQNYILLEELDAVILSHYHGDHIADIQSLQYSTEIMYKLGKRNKDLKIYGINQQPYFNKLSYGEHCKAYHVNNKTVLNIIKGLRWLDNKEDGDDISFIYITTHGSPLGFDIPPFDESDDSDEILMSFWGFSYPIPPFSFIWDDQLNFFLNRLESKGICLIIDSCFAGGFNDSFSVCKGKNKPPNVKRQISPIKWNEDFVEDIRGNGRVVRMSSREDEISIGRGFSPFIIDGLNGYADDNLDGVITAEELYYYSKPRSFWQHPTIYDNYPDELPILALYPNINHTNKKSNKYDDEFNFIFNKKMITNFGENAVICGYVVDADTKNPIEDVWIDLEWHDDPLNMDWNYTRTDSQGFFLFNVAKGYVTLRYFSHEYLYEKTEVFNIKEQDVLWINNTLESIPPETVIVCGYIRDLTTNESLDDLFVDLEWIDSDGRLYWNYTEGNQYGFFSMNIAPGEFYLNIFPDDYPWKRTYRNDVIENEIFWCNLSLARSISIDLIKPLNALYIKNKLIVPLPKSFIFGSIDIEVNVTNYWYEPIVVDRVDFYIDNSLKNSDNSPPYIWEWKEKTVLKNQHTITIKVYDDNGYIITKNFQVRKIF